MLPVWLRRDGAPGTQADLVHSLLDSATPIGIITADLDGVIHSWSRGMEQLLGYPASQAVGSRLLADLCPPPAGSEGDPLRSLIDVALRERTSAVRDLSTVNHAGERVWVQYAVSPLFGPDDRPIGSLIFAEDTSARIQLIGWLRDREANYKELADSISDMFFALDGEARCTYWNRASETLLGISERDAVGKDVRELFGYRSNSGIDAFCIRSLRSHEHSIFSAEIEVKGERLAYEISAYPTKDGISVFGRDVTWRKKAYDQLVYQSNILKNVLNSVIVTDLEGRITYWNHIAARTFGYEFTELRETSGAIIYPDRDEARFRDDLERVRRGTDWTGEWEGRHKDGRPVWVDLKRTLMRNSDGDPIGVVSVSVDITERKQAERRLQESEEKYRELGESISDIFFGLDPDLHVTYWNKASEILTGIPRDDAAGKSVTTVIPPFCTDQTMDRLQEVMRAKRHQTFETRLLLAGHDLFFEITIYPAVSGLSVVARDVTERRRAEQAVEASLHEKEALLKEIHHRVKNNLQIISSLLSLQSQQIRNRKALDALTESQARVRSMALIHEQLYQSQDLAHIDFSQYVRDLAAHLFRTYVTQGPNVRLIVDVRNVYLDADHAITCGMIINELVSNALKHAFPAGTQGTLRIATEWESEDRLRLLVGDTGKGIPPSIDHTNTPSLGLKLVRMLAEQLRGTIELSRTGGTTFTVRFSTKPVRRT